MGRWDRTCSALAASAPLVVLLLYVPAEFKPLAGVACVWVTLIAAMYAPPAALYLLLVSIFASPVLFSAGGGEGNWGKFCAVALFAGLLPHRLRNREPAVRIPREMWLFVLIAVAMVLSTLYNGVTVGASRYLAWAITPLMFLATYNCLASPQEIYTALVGLVALVQAVMSLAVLTGDFSVEVGKNALGELGNANTLAMFLVLVVPGAMYLYLQSPRRAIRLWSLATIVAVILMCVWIASRGAILGLVAAAGVVLLRAKLPKKNVAVLLAVVVVGLGALPASVRSGVLARFRQETPGSRLSVVTRELIFRAGIREFQSSPWFGYGYERSRYLLVLRDPSIYEAPEINTHNVYLQVALELGLFGLIPFVALILAAAMAAIRAARSRGPATVHATRLLGWCLLATLVTTVVCSLFLGNFESRVWYATLGLVIAAADTLSPRPRRGESRDDPGTARGVETHMRQATLDAWH
jgi:O-antigen ligase